MEIWQDYRERGDGRLKWLGNVSLWAVLLSVFFSICFFWLVDCKREKFWHFKVALNIFFFLLFGW